MCGKQNNGPKDVHIIVPGTWEYATLLAQRGITGVIRLRPNVITGYLKVKQKGRPVRV